MSIFDDDVSAFEGHAIVDSSGVEFGEIEAICGDDAGDEPRWARVLLDVGGDAHTFVPLRGASLAGDDLRIAYDVDQVIEGSRAELSELPGHYGLQGPPPRWP